MKKYRFNFHYNKPASIAAGRNMLTIHYRGVCYLVESIVCNVPVETKDRARQPHCVMVGKGNLEIDGKVGIIS